MFEIILDEAGYTGPDLVNRDPWLSSQRYGRVHRLACLTEETGQAGGLSTNASARRGPREPLRRVRGLHGRMRGPKYGMIDVD
jgi:hypothetical protein